ncbi:disease resistance protein RGA4-like [Lolium rigidum]|uniref:disease resistance protein RGA4-like n=1 Tax=Lolium rigidum TaxID=89674 RepID=UPI001F5D8D7A|nr:disease resistance protein RGA4-like [Lolium rigidum]
MEAAVAGSILKTVVGKLFEVLRKEYEKHKNLTQDVEQIMLDLDMFYAASGARSEGCRSTVVETRYSEEMLDIAHDVEDCIDRFTHRLVCKQLGARPFRSLTKAAICSSFAGDIQKIRSRIKEAHQRVMDNPISGTTSRRRYGDPTITRRDMVGIGKAVEDLVSLLYEVECEKEQLRVISVVGFGGLGKTTLARAVYDSPRTKERFPCRAWVTAAGRSPEIDGGGFSWILREIVRQVLPREKEVMDVDDGQRHLQDTLTDYLQDNRYLIVIDDVRMEQWDTIRSILKDNGKGSRILVTTTIQSVANICSHGNGYVYHVKSLGNDDSKKIALPGVPSPLLEEESAMLLKKCDGLPLALVSVSDYLKSSSESTVKQCGELCRNLGSHLKEEKHGLDHFAELREVLLDNYESLSGYAQTCLLYLGLFRNDRPLKRKVVVRRWLAEGYARNDPSRSEEDIAHENFKMLIDRNIIRDTRNNGQVKTCRTHGIMHEFVLHKSLSLKFIAASSLDRPRAPYSVNARHLSIHGGDATYKYSGGAYGKKGLSRVRSVTLSGNTNAAADAISYVVMCELLRVLDLGDCSDLKDDHLKDIGKLLYLRYLSLGSSITKLPKSIIGKLHCLETLDLRRTKINTLPRKVIELPHLLHLFGRFMLEKDDLKKASKIRKLRKFLSEESNLQTLAGFDTDGEEGFLQFVGQMRKLRKMKIWCKPCANGSSSNYWADLSKAIQEFAKVPMVYAGNQGARSLSINSEECSGELLSSINFGTCPDGFVYEMTSLKLQGEFLRGLPPFVTMLSGLTELCISSATATLTRDVLSALFGLRCLLYLKLIAHQLESFEMRNGALPSLERLCFVLQSPAPALPTMEQGALPNLVSLQLLCPWLDGLSGMNIRHLERLKEVTIHAGVTGQTRQAWEGAAKNHRNRPTLKTVGEIEEEEASSTREKRKNYDSSTDELGLDSGIKRIRLSVPEPPPIQLVDAASSSYLASPLHSEDVLQFAGMCNVSVAQIDEALDAV